MVKRLTLHLTLHITSNKLQRGYTDLVDIWGSDHHGYISRESCD
ncbi:hypothetical protein ABVN80_18310 [Acinetobacter baumannii]